MHEDGRYGYYKDSDFRSKLEKCKHFFETIRFGTDVKNTILGMELGPKPFSTGLGYWARENQITCLILCPYQMASDCFQCVWYRADFLKSRIRSLQTIVFTSRCSNPQDYHTYNLHASESLKLILIISTCRGGALWRGRGGKKESLQFCMYFKANSSRAGQGGVPGIC